MKKKTEKDIDLRVGQKICDNDKRQEERYKKKRIGEIILIEPNDCQVKWELSGRVTRVSKCRIGTSASSGYSIVFDS